MHEFPPVDVKRSLICLVCYAISHLRPKHHLIATHIVIHHVLELRHEGLFVDDVKIYDLICCYLDSDVAFDVVDETSDLNRVEQNPAFDICHSIDFLFEEINVT